VLFRNNRVATLTARTSQETLTGTCPTVFTGIYLTYVIRGLDCEKNVCDCVFWDV